MFQHDRSREATSSIRGYVYQAYQSVLAWLNLADGEILYLERGEDFDVEFQNKVEVVQVKDLTTKSITLRTADVVKAINNYWEHFTLNAGRSVFMRFLTTASTGIERGEPFGAEVNGLDYWELVGRGFAAPQPLRTFLLTLHLNGPLRTFIEAADDEALSAKLLRRIKWDVGQRPKDGVEAAIRSRLVEIGYRFGESAPMAERVINPLLRHVADLMSAPGERRLLWADALRIFGDACTEVVSRTEIAALRRSSAALIAVAATSPLVGLTTAPRVLGEPLPIVRGASHRAGVITRLLQSLLCHRTLILRGSTGLGKTTLARLLTDGVGGNWVWAGFRDREERQIADLLRRASLEMSAFQLTRRLVLDDLPLHAAHRFERELLALKFEMDQLDGLLLITTASPCSADLLDKLWLQPECDCEVPYLDEAEITELTEAHGLANANLRTAWARALLLATNGHPQLVHARTKKLQGRGWPSLSNADWISVADIDQVRASTRRRLSDDLPDTLTRRLAYRLSLLSRDFDRTLALQIAAIQPRIELPGDHLDLLVGPWVEQLPRDRFRISPLLSNAGKEALDDREQRAVHETVSLGYFRTRSITPWDVGTALFHAFAAESLTALLHWARVIAKAEPAAQAALGDALFWFSSMSLEPGQRLCNTNRACDFFLRLGQFKVAAAACQQDRALRIIPALRRAAQELHGMEGSTAALACSIVLATPSIRLPIGLYTDLLLDFAALAADDSVTDKLPEFAGVRFSGGLIEGMSPAQAFFYMATAHITCTADLEHLFGRLDQTDDRIKSSLLTVFTMGLDHAELLIAATWLHEAEDRILNLEPTDEALQRLGQVGRRWGIPGLTIATYVARSVIADEYGRDANRGLSVVEDGLREFKDNPRLLAQRTKVLFHSDRIDEAAAVARHVATLEQTLSRIEASFFFRLAGISEARLKHWEVAEAYFLRAAGEIDANGPRRAMLLGLQADAAFARWKQARQAEALALFGEVLVGLTSLDATAGLRERCVHATVRHTLAWMNADLVGLSPSVQDLTYEPPPGFCSNQEPSEQLKEHRLVDLPAVWGILGTIEEALGLSLGFANRARNDVTTDLPLLVECELRRGRFEGVWRTGRFEVLIPAAIDLLSAMACQRTAFEEGKDLWQPRLIPTLAAGYWENFSSRTSFLLLLLAGSVSATARGANRVLPIAIWRDDLHAAGIQGPDVDRFLANLDGNTSQELDDPLGGAAAAVALLRRSAVDLRDGLRAFLRLLNALGSADWGRFAADDLATIASQFWTHAIEAQRFGFRAPAVSCPIIRDRISDESITGIAKVASIIDAATEAIGIALSPAAKEMLQILRSGRMLYGQK